MYQITRKNRIKETLQLCNPDGSVAEEIDVDLDIDSMASRVNKAYEMLGMAQSDLERNMDSLAKIDAYGNAVFAFFDVIFGNAGRVKIERFYDGHYTEMLLDIFPFIMDVIMPKINELSEQRKNELLALAHKG